MKKINPKTAEGKKALREMEKDEGRGFTIVFDKPVRFVQIDLDDAGALTRVIGALREEGLTSFNTKKGAAQHEVHDFPPPPTNKRPWKKTWFKGAQRVTRRMVTKYGVSLFGRAEFYQAPELADLIGQRVDCIFDLANMGSVEIYQGDRKICEAVHAVRLKYRATQADVRAVMKRERSSKETRENA